MTLGNTGKSSNRNRKQKANKQQKNTLWDLLAFEERKAENYKYSMKKYKNVAGTERMCLLSLWLPNVEQKEGQK